MGFRLLLVAAVLTAVALGAIGWSVGPWRDTHSGTPAPTAPSPPTGDISAGLTTYPQGKRPHVPDVSGTTLSGSSLSLHDLRGHVVVLNVWASWCYPCRREAPELARLAHATRDEGVRFVGINTRDSSGAARAFARRYGIPYPSISDPRGDVVRSLNGLVPVNGVPSTLVIDRSGRVAARKIGRIDGAVLGNAIDDVRA